MIRSDHVSWQSDGVQRFGGRARSSRACQDAQSESGLYAHSSGHEPRLPRHIQTCADIERDNALCWQVAMSVTAEAAQRVNREPLFSYVVATYNCRHLLDVLAATALRLQNGQAEICVSDGGSTDGTTEVLRSMPGVRVVCSAPDAGIYDAWNRALPYVRGRYIGFIGADDRPCPPFLEAAAAAIAAADQAQRRSGLAPAALIFGDILMHRKGRVRRLAAPQRLRLFDGRGAVFDLHHPGCLTRADLFDGNRSFDASFKLAGDLDFYRRVAPAVRTAGTLRLEHAQAEVTDDGVSRQPQSLALYNQEYARIEQRSGQRLGYGRTAFPVLALLARLPWLYGWGKDLSWALRGRRAQPHT